MSLDFSNYSGLKTSIAGAMHRDNLTGDIPGMIQLCEAEMQRNLDVAEQESTSTLSVAAGSSTVALPTGYLGLRRIRQNIGGAFRTLWPTALAVPGWTVDAVGGWAQNIAIQGGNIVITPTPSEALSLLLDYYGKFTALSDSNTTNWILTSHPDAYYYGALTHASLFVGSDPRATIRLAQFTDKFKNAMNEIARLDRRKRFGSMKTRSDAPGVYTGKYDIRFG